MKKVREKPKCIAVWLTIFPAVYQYYGATQGWDRQEIKQQVIDVYTAADVSNYSQLDTTSIMM